MKRLLGLLVLLTLLFPSLGEAQARHSEFIITLKSGDSLDRTLAAYHASLIKSIPGTNVRLIRTDDTDPFLLAKLKADAALDSAEPNDGLKLSDSAETLFLLDDSAETLFLLDSSQRTALNGVDVPLAYAKQPALSIISGDQVRGISTGAATRVVTIDTGVDFNHPALKPWLDPGLDLINGRSASEFDGLELADSGETIFLLDGGGIGVPAAFGHGTLVAGTIHLVAPSATIVPIKAFDAYGRSSQFTIIEAVYSALSMKADVINMSFTTTITSPALKKAIFAARSAGVSLVAAMGNAGQNVEDAFPAAYPDVIGVAATDFEDHVAAFSNYGKATAISAPGAYVISTFPSGRYAAVWGTSFSAPLVSGTVSLLSSLSNRGQSYGPTVVNSADSIDGKNPNYQKLLGKGRLNARRALEHR